MKQFISAFSLAVIISFGILIYTGIYFDIPREKLEKKYALGPSAFLMLNDGSRIHYRDEGANDESIILMLHGFNGSLFNFESLVSLLKSHHRVVTIDLPGFGLTGSIPKSSYTFETYFEVITALSNHLNIEEFSILGNSMGGGIAWRYALKYPEIVSNVILLSSSGFEDTYQKKELNREDDQRPIAWRLMSSTVIRFFLSYYTPKFFATQGLKTSVFDQSLATKELAHQFHELTLLEGSRKAILSRLSNQRGGNEDIKFPKEFKMRALIIHGKEDKIIPFESSLNLAGYFKNPVVKIYDNIGHLPMIEDPEKVANDVNLFLKVKI